jgi:hypothetical protein
MVEAHAPLRGAMEGHAPPPRLTTSGWKQEKASAVDLQDAVFPVERVAHLVLRLTRHGACHWQLKCEDAANATLRACRCHVLALSTQGAGSRSS